MDEFLNDVRVQLKLAHASLKQREARLEARAVGYIMRRNQLAHTRALIALVEEVQLIASHEPEEWWEDEESVPF